MICLAGLLEGNSKRLNHKAKTRKNTSQARLTEHWRRETPNLVPRVFHLGDERHWKRDWHKPRQACNLPTGHVIFLWKFLLLIFRFLLSIYSSSLIIGFLIVRAYSETKEVFKNCFRFVFSKIMTSSMRGNFRKGIFLCIPSWGIDGFTWRNCRYVGAQNKREKNIGNLTLSSWKTWDIICFCFMHWHGRLNTWLITIYTSFSVK